jgi:hypothetical protein
MFETAVEAGAGTAATWTPERSEPGGGGCCPLCFSRYRVLVLDGPLRDLPHAVAHAVVRAVDERIRARVEASPTGLHDAAAAARRSEAIGGLLLVALEELGVAEDRLAALRRRCTEPALEHYLATHPVEEVPDEWCGPPAPDAQ